MVKRKLRCASEALFPAVVMVACCLSSGYSFRVGVQSLVVGVAPPRRVVYHGRSAAARGSWTSPGWGRGAQAGDGWVLGKCFVLQRPKAGAICGLVLARIKKNGLIALAETHAGHHVMCAWHANVRGRCLVLWYRQDLQQYMLCIARYPLFEFGAV